MAENEILTLTFESIQFEFENDNGREPTIIGFCSRLDDNQAVTIKGEANPEELTPGCDYDFLGHWFTYKGKGGHQQQFAFNSFIPAVQKSRRGIISYLSGAPNLGRKRAEAIYDAFGENSTTICRENPEMVCAKVKGVTPDRAKEIATWLHSQRKKEKLHIELNELLDGRGFPSTVKKWAIRKWGMNAPEQVRKAYPLLPARGVGFRLCDKMYLQLGNDPLALKRQALAAWYGIDSAAKIEGHTWVPLMQPVERLRGLVGHSTNPAKALELGKRSKLINVLRTNSLDGEIASKGDVLWFSTGINGQAELFLSELLAELIDEEPGWGIDERPEGLSDHQYEKIRECLSKPVAILTGGGGTGKSHSAACVIKHILKTNGGGGVAACAPTGKAASRLQQYLLDHGLNLRVRTTHSLLQVQAGGDGADWEFVHHEGNPLPYRFLLVDESSMKDVPIMVSLLRACKRGTHILFIGDTAQLPPVGHGAPLRDMINGGIPHAELTEIHRNEGGILRNCKLIRHGQQIDPDPQIVLGEDKNFFLLPAAGGQHSIDKCIGLIELLADNGFDPFNDIQVIVPTNKTGPLSRENLNNHLAVALNPSEDRNPGEEVKFRRGDKVICLRNQFIECIPPVKKVGDVDPDEELFAEIFGDDGEKQEVFVANGEQGIVSSISGKNCIVELDQPRRTVRLKVNSAGTVQDWTLSYAITCHKSQGSQWPVAVVILDDGAKQMLSRQWFYTACSRAEKLTVLIGREITANRAVKKEGLQRKTFLAERLRNEIEKRNRCSWCASSHEGGPENCITSASVAQPLEDAECNALGSRASGLQAKG